MSKPLGAQWTAQFPTSTSTTDLVEPFRSNLEAFIGKLREEGASVTISATYRPAERAYLMHYCCMIAQSKMDPALIPPMEGVDIQWDLGNAEATYTAANQMMKAYGIAFPAALASRHTQRRAIDMTVHGTTKSHAELVSMGKTFGVIKLETDPPHWSDDGH
jgi:D-alanyl-D-alanine dipeptidase